MAAIPIFSGAISSVSNSAVQAIANQAIWFDGGFLWNPSGPAGSWSVDNSNYIDFEAGPFSIKLPRGFYPSGVWVKRVSGAADITVKVVLYPVMQ